MRLPTSPRGAVLVVSHDSNGFVRRRPCGLVASHCRPWGSPGFLPSADVAADIRHSSRAPDPSKLSPPHQVDTVTEPLLVRSPNVQPLSRLALFRPAHRPKPARSSKVAPTSGVSRWRIRCRATALPRWSARCSLGLLSDSRLSPVVLLGDTVWPKPLVVLFGARPKPGTSRRWTCRSTSTVPTRPSLPSLSPLLLPPKWTSHWRRASRPCSRSRVGSPRSKLRAGAAAFQDPPLPMAPVTVRDTLLISVGASACADRRACAFRRRGCPHLVAQAFTSLSRPRE